MPDDEQPGTPVRDEAARQAVALLFGLAAVVIYAVAQRKATQPDSMRTERMRLLKHAERVAARSAGWLWGQAERARRAYERESA
jgi:hypothetical protein